MEVPAAPSPATMIPTYADVLADRHLNDDELTHEFKLLKAYKPRDTSRCFAGNPILYHFQMDNLCKVKTGKGQSFYDIMADDKQREEWWIRINKYAHGSRPNKPATRLFEIYRRCSGAVVFFKPTIAINMYHKYNATKVLDVCAGWGGRMLAAMAMEIGYTGIDTNVNLKPSYDAMMAKFGNATMLWGDALEQDFAQIDYDFALTSPPYWDTKNVEIYELMKIWKTQQEFYEDFLIPLINKTRASIRRNGKVAFNISPKMYKILTEKYKYPACEEAVPMLQQKVRGKDKEDMVYVW
jgi:hypothetical protein